MNFPPKAFLKSIKLIGNSIKILLPLVLFFSVLTASHADDGFYKFLSEGEPELSLRYRFAAVNQDGLPENASASTLQTLLGYKTATVSGVSAYVQFRNVSNIGSENYNNTINGRTTYPVVADPTSTEVDQAYIRFSASDNVALTAGRRKLQWGNQRFISALGWRQNNRSFDMLFNF